jgi:hypothetical protein
MLIRFTLALALVAVLAPAAAHAQSDTDSADALSQTLGSMQGLSPNAAGSLDPRLGAIEQSPELRREFNELTNAMLTELVQRSGGDPDQMNAEVERARSDPAAFAESFSPSTRARLEALSRKLEQ